MSRVRADKFTNRAGTGAPTFPFGLTGTATTAQGLTGTPNIVVGDVTATTGSFSGNVSVGGTLTYEDVTNIDSVGLVTARSGIRVTGGYSKLTGVIETVSVATTYNSGSQMVLELDMQGSTTYTYTGTANIGIVSFKNMPADAQNGATVTLIHTQNATGTANTTATTGLGLTCTVIPYVNDAAIAGVSTSALVGSGTTITLSSTASDRDFVSFFVHYTGGTTTEASSYQVYATKNGGFRQG